MGFQELGKLLSHTLVHSTVEVTSKSARDAESILEGPTVRHQDLST